jgi:long-chain acyl-CoA synthetase
MPTILHRLSAWADSDPNSIAQRYKKDKRWLEITAREYCNRIYWLALFLESKGMGPEDVGIIFSYNCPQWVHIDLAALLLGAKSAGIYPNSTFKDISFILNQTQSKCLSVQNKEYFQRVIEDGSEVPSYLDFILVFEGDTSFSPKAISYESALAVGRTIASSKDVKTLSQYLEKLDPNAGAFIIYTSGTTGSPKGALLSEDNLVYTIDLVVRHWHLPSKGSLFSFLPLCHIAEKIQNIGAGICQRYTVNFCSKFENVSSELPEVEPTLLLCVPRLWEKMMEGVLKKINDGKGAKKQLALWALKMGSYISELKYLGARPRLLDWIQWKVADQLVLSKIRKALGLGKAEALASGAAALPAHVCMWFRSLGL